MVHVKFIAQDELFRAVFTRCPDDPLVWLLDVRSQNKFKRGHIMSAFCIRATANGETLLVSSCCNSVPPEQNFFAGDIAARPMLTSASTSQDYSQNEYNKPWAKDCWSAAYHADQSCHLPACQVLPC